MFFSYSETELNLLRKKAPELAPLIDRFGIIRRQMTPDLFTALAQSVIGQQISVKAADTILGRLESRFGKLSPDIFLENSDDAVIACGVTRRKTGYMKGISEAVRNGMTKEALEPLSDTAIIRQLTLLRGIGEWTAEMMLIFCFGRKDVLSYGDFGIRTALARLHGIEKPTKALFEEDRLRFSPYGTIASFYLWESNKTAAG